MRGIILLSICKDIFAWFQIRYTLQFKVNPIDLGSGGVEKRQLVLDFLFYWDNPVKPAQNILSEKDGFNDKFIQRAIVETEMLRKGEFC